MKLAWCLAFLLVLYVTNTESQLSPGALRHCGDNLVELLNSLCKGIFGSPSKKFVIDVMNFPRKYQEIDNENRQSKYSTDLDLSYFNNRRLQPLPPFFSRKIRDPGVVDECCYKPCTNEQLLQYCGK
uniref:Insulin-like peptide 2 n=1 Tax=Dendroctonus armandi TaxID=77159 RepID=A0A9E8ADL3_9CUCU|nr:insulin-like peptide 2 [Dendroctonus armandi]